MVHFLENIQYNGKLFISIVFILCLLQAPSLFAQQCATNQFCTADDLGKAYDFRGQSTYAKFSPGDTCRIQAILYSGNDERIMVCSDPKLGQIQFKVYKTMYVYSQIFDRINKKEEMEPVYKMDKKGKPISKLDNWGKPLRDFYGDIVFEIESYKRVVKTDTIWKIAKKTKEEILFDSRKDGRVFNQKIKTTEPIMIEMVVPQTSDAKGKQYKGCVGIMIGRIFHSTSFKN